MTVCGEERGKRESAISRRENGKGKSGLWEEIMYVVSEGIGDARSYD